MNDQFSSTVYPTNNFDHPQATSSTTRPPDLFYSARPNLGAYQLGYFPPNNYSHYPPNLNHPMPPHLVHLSAPDPNPFRSNAIHHKQPPNHNLNYFQASSVEQSTKTTVQTEPETTDSSVADTDPPRSIEPIQTGTNHQLTDQAYFELLEVYENNNAIPQGSIAWPSAGHIYIVAHEELRFARDVKDLYNWKYDSKLDTEQIIIYRYRFGMKETGETRFRYTSIFKKFIVHCKKSKKNLSLVHYFGE